MLAPLERKNGWTLAEQAGEVCPDGMQRLLNQADWDADAVRDEVRGFVLEHLGAEDGVLIVDETGFIKKGVRSAGVQRQYTGTSGKIDNCQLGVFLAYASDRGRALIDRELYLPTCSGDPARRADARIDDDVGFATKSSLARAMLARAVDAGMPFRWVTGDEVYGQDPVLRGWIAQRRLGYVLAIGCKHRCGPRGQNARIVSAILPEEAWEIRSAGDGAHGLREYAWALVPLPGRHEDGFEDALLIRRSLADGERAYYLTHAPASTPLAEIVRAAGARWAIEECFQAAKSKAGLNHYQVRHYRAWYRHITLAMAAAAHLAAVRVTEAEKGEAPMT